jgi:lipoprotein-anchoring transpeptidase ErfK/SrfK
MKRQILALLPCLLAAIAPAAGGERYGARPPVYLSPDITEPWMLQLRPTVRPGYRDVTGLAPVVVPDRQPAPSFLSSASDGTAERQAVATIQPVKAPKGVDPRLLPQEVAYDGPARPGTIVVNTVERYLYLVEDGGKARRYGVGVGRPGFEWAGEHTVTRKAEWPDWTPPAAMRKRQPHLPQHMEGGPDNPLGARALYLGSTEYRIHGTSEPWTIGQAVSSGCIRMRNEDVTDLYERVKVGTKVQVI